jgi:hypothetical protein
MADTPDTQAPHRLDSYTHTNFRDMQRFESSPPRAA